MTGVPKSYQEKYNQVITDYFTDIGVNAPEAQVNNLAGCFPKAYFSRAVDACQHKIELVHGSATPAVLEFLVQARNDAEDIARKLSTQER